MQGDSDLTVTVTGSYSTSYDGSTAGSASVTEIDRTTYDEAFGTEDTSESASSTAVDTASDASDQEQQEDQGFFAAIIAWFKSLFS